MGALNDDRVGRTLDRLFDCDRASLLTELVVRMIHEFDLDLSRLHNDSTTVTFHGDYDRATGVAQGASPPRRLRTGTTRITAPISSSCCSS